MFRPGDHVLFLSADPRCRWKPAVVAEPEGYSVGVQPLTHCNQHHQFVRLEVSAPDCRPGCRVFLVRHRKLVRFAPLSVLAASG